MSGNIDLWDIVVCSRLSLSHSYPMIVKSESLLLLRSRHVASDAILSRRDGAECVVRSGVAVEAVLYVSFFGDLVQGFVRAVAGRAA
jgi:hypothetical protein